MMIATRNVESHEAQRQLEPKAPWSAGPARGTEAASVLRPRKMVDDWDENMINLSFI